MFHSSIKRDPDPVLARTSCGSGGLRERARTQFTPLEVAEKSDPRGTAIGIHVGAAREVAINSDLGNVRAQLTAALFQERA